MTKQPEQMNLSPEGAQIARAVNQRLGVKADVLAIKTRSGGDGGERKKPVVEECLEFGWVVYDDSADELSVPFLHYYRPKEGSVLSDIRFGISILQTLGISSRWSIVGRRNGTKLFRLDYDNEVDCEADQGVLKAAFEHWLARYDGKVSWTVELQTQLMSEGAYSFPLVAYRLEEFDPRTGQTTRVEDFRSK